MSPPSNKNITLTFIFQNGSPTGVPITDLTVENVSGTAALGGVN